MADMVRYTREQHFEWGSILWFIEPDDLDLERLSVGLATVAPGTRHSLHSRSHEEQILYVIAGEGEHTDGGRVEPLTPGRILHIPPHADQEISNRSEEELRLLLVYSPSRFHSLVPAFASGDATEEPEPDEEEGDIRTLFDATVINSIRAIMDRLAQALGLSLALLDVNGKGILKTDNHPVLCSCLAEHTQGRYCQLQMDKTFREMAALPLEELHKPRIYYCCHNIASTIIPLVHRRKIQAYMKCGEIFLTREDREELRAKLPDIARENGVDPGFLTPTLDEIPIEPKSRLYTAAEATFVIANTIMGMVAQTSREKELTESKLSLAQEQLATATLEKALHEADLKLLQSQVTPHFLFNTLSTIAQMAYLEGAPKAAGLTWSLSELLRSTLRKTEERISLKEEISLLRNYLTIQEARFGDRLSFSVEIDPAAESMLIPCMLFQPLVENAIIHGFESITGKGIIRLAAWRDGSWLHAFVADDGAGFDVEQMQSNPKKIGLRSTWSRLEHYFGKNYTFAVTSKPGKGCRIDMAFQTSEDTPHA